MRTKRRAFRLGGEGFLEEMMPKPMHVSQKKEEEQEGQVQRTYTSSHQQDRAIAVS